MKNFAQLIKTLDSSNKTNVKVDALTTYFKNASPEDKVWTIAILSHRRPARPVNTTLLRLWANELANIPLWLFEESYHIVGDLAETIALIIPSTKKHSDKSLTEFLQEIIALKKKTDPEKKEYLHENWMALNYYERFVFTKLITGSFRIGVSQKLMTRALSKAEDVDEDALAYKLMGNWNPNTITFQELILDEKSSDYLSKPYPFYLAYPIEGDVEDLGNPEDWSIEHKWDGIRSQTIIRDDEIYVWSRGEELVTDKYPEFKSFVGIIPNGTVIDAEILAFPENEIGTFNDLQARIGRKTISANLLEKVPVILKAYDILEWEGKDIRNLPYIERRKLLEDLYDDIKDQTRSFRISERVSLTSWEDVAKERERAREMKSEGLMLKRNTSPYQVGRKKGDWWKWKIEPLVIDAVLTYAMRGHGRRSNLFTDYTFALWQNNENGEKELVTFAKAYSGLTDAEFRKVDDFIKKNTLERFGPVRSVTPQLVFEIGFEGISLSKRHKSGIATRFPRILRWRQDKKIEEANSIEDLKNMIS
ncbi:ATP-dependent DNA ligase [Flavobacterium sp. WLB]|uniref:ATP-dependent DNA ligase n=1 Tax=unclassified Flavobacterium TaxID=196869 RepID=UPI0006ABED4E|nr:MULTISPECIES: ATP-dependent DNA ligase [unclassified Flavobacterium]KOP38100.1 ATP-dependent DNA ligase [Flavobacterium sp. VMW]OWU88367.1 ATP-dependent DNA ligase [Flavobacterium sp. NLM]PUU69860.1 ATP-dependent DNA ligase [Flavobacterium sp. WLB]